MRSKALSMTVLSVLILCAGCRSYVGDPYRSERLPNASAAEAIGRYRTYDLRDLFLTRSEIEHLEARRSCLVDSVGYASARREISVGSGLSLDKVIQELLHHPYDGQIKVISRDSIIQTPRVTYEPERQKSIQVNPGDLVLILARD